MRLKTIRLITGITVFVLLGILFTQYFWVEHAMELKQEQFNNRVRIALKTVVNHLFNLKAGQETVLGGGNVRPCMLSDEHIYSIIDPHKLDSLVQNEFGCMRIKRDFEYAVYNHENGKLLMGQFERYKPELLESDFSVSLSCLHRSDNYFLAVYFPNLKSVMVGKMIGWVLLTALLMLVLFGISAYTVYSLFRQKRLSEMKNDFVNNMTHEFKTPISSVSLASEMLFRPEVNTDSNKVIRYAHLIFDENMRLKNQVENILQIAVLDRNNFNIRERKIDVHAMLQKLASSFEIRFREKNGSIGLELKAEEHEIYADKIHLSNIFTNLLDNAEKYSPENPLVRIKTQNNARGIVVSIQDNGIGISKENQKLVFRKLYRVPTGNLHDVKGFGLGLYYVKRMVEAHHGEIRLYSELRKGSRFEVFMPFAGSKSF